LSLHDEVRFGTDAQRLLSDPTLVKAFDDVEAAILQRWKAAPVRDRDAQHELKLMFKLLGDVRANLEQAVSDGKMAAHELKIQQQRQSPLQKLRSVLR
jgi:hypothetical protein